MVTDTNVNPQLRLPFFGSFKKLIHGVLLCFTADISGSSKITGRSGQKDSMTKREYSNVLPRIIRPLSLFLWWNLSDSCSCSRSHTPPNSQQGSSLTLRNPVSCADSAKKKREVSGMVSLPQIHHQFAIRNMKGFGSSSWGPTEEAIINHD